MYPIREYMKLVVPDWGTVIPFWKYLKIVNKMATLRKQAYSNVLKISPPKTESFQTKNSEIFHTSAQNIDCGYSLEPPRRGGSNEYPQTMFFEQKRDK